MTSLTRGKENGFSRTINGKALAGPFLRWFLVLLLIAVIIAEEYSVFVLRDKIARQNERLQSISVELQTLKNERNALGEELSSMKKLAGDKNHGDTPERKD